MSCRKNRHRHGHRCRAQSTIVGIWNCLSALYLLAAPLTPDKGPLEVWGNLVYKLGLLKKQAPTNLGPYFADNVTTLTLPPDSSGSVYREASFDDIFSTGVADTIRLYYNFQGVTSSSTQLVFPTIFQASEGVPPGFSVSEQIYVCANGHTFCDDYVVGGGTLIGMTTWTSVGTLFTQFAATVPATTFNMDLVFTVVSAGGTGQLGDVAGAILAQPDPPNPVPGPIVGAGLPGLVAGMFGLWGWRRRKTSLSLNG
jgi:hypothetical protein